MVTGLWFTHDSKFGSLSWSWRCKDHPCPLSPHSGLWRMLKVLEWGLASWSCLDMVTGLWSTHDPNFCSLSWFWKWKNIHVFQVLIWEFWGSWRILSGVWHLDLNLDIVTGLWYAHVLNFVYVAKKIQVLKSLFWTFKDAGGSWLVFGILILIWIW